MNEPYGRFGSPRPARERRIASDTATIASSWPTTRLCSSSSMCTSLSRSPCIMRDTGMPVARDTTSAISSAPTCVRSSFGLVSSASLLSACFSCAFSSGSRPYSISAAFCQSLLRLASSICWVAFSISSLMWAPPCTTDFSAFQTSSRSAYSCCSLPISSSISASRFSEASSVSFFTASRSIFNWIRRRSSRSITSGLESISILILEAASSIRSIALSGRKRPVM